MRSIFTCLLPLFLLACSSNQNTTPDDPNDPGFGGAPGAGGGSTQGGGGSPPGSSTASTGAGGTPDNPPNPIDFEKEDYSDEDATVDDALSAVLAGPTQLTKDGVPVGITKDDRIVYRSPQGLFSVKAAPGAPPRMAALVPGNVHVRGSAIFNFANVDWKTSSGILTFWTPKVGRRSVGTAMIGDNRIAARNDAAYVMFARNLQTTTMDIVVSSADAEQAFVLVEGAGRGDADTCAPTFGFAGQSAVVAWCAVGSAKATLARFTLSAEGVWQKEVISQEAKGTWSSDDAGDRLFYLTLGGQAMVKDSVGDKQIGQGVGWGLMHPAGSAVFFSVGDQLRRSDMNSPAVPIVVDGFQAPVAWSDDLAQLVYSSKTVYDPGKMQDLRATATAWFNPTPAVLVDQPIATVARSTLSTDAKTALYLTEVNNQGGTLHTLPVGGGAETTLPGVDTVLSASGGVVLFTDNRSPQGVYPVLVDLKVLDTVTATPHLLEAGIDDGRNIQVTTDKGRVAYRRPGGPDVGGIWIRTIE